MPKPEEKKTSSSTIAVVGIICGTVIAVTVPCVAMLSGATGSHVFVLAFIGLVLGASAVITAVAKK